MYRLSCANLRTCIERTVSKGTAALAHEKGVASSDMTEAQEVGSFVGKLMVSLALFRTELTILPDELMGIDFS